MSVDVAAASDDAVYKTLASLQRGIFEIEWREEVHWYRLCARQNKPHLGIITDRYTPVE